MSTAQTAPVLPRDARLIALLLAANGAEDCEEGVVRMLVEFAHREPTAPLCKRSKLTHRARRVHLRHSQRLARVRRAREAGDRNERGEPRAEPRRRAAVGPSEDRGRVCPKGGASRSRPRPSLALQLEAAV